MPPARRFRRLLQYLALLVSLVVLMVTSAVSLRPRNDDQRAQAAATAGDMVGVNAQLLWQSDPSADVRAIVGVGIRWIRADFAWAAIEPEPGIFRWEASDRLMAAAAGEGANVLAILGYSAPWASSDPSGDNAFYPPSSPEAFARFSAAVAQRYGPAGTFWDTRPDVPVVPLTAMEIWNEPWGDWSWRPVPDVARYAAMVRTVAEAVRAVQPGMRLLASGDLLSYRDDEQQPWLESLLDEDPEISDVIDAWSIHPYPDPPSLAPWDTDREVDYTFLGRLEQVRSILQTRDAWKPLWITEIGWCTGAGPCAPVTEDDQREYLLWALEHLSRQWSAEVEHVFVFTWERRAGSSHDWRTRFGLRREDGSFTPAWYGLEQFLSP
jgi:hypothetical protein